VPNRIALQAFVHSDADYAAPSMAALVVIRRLEGMGSPEPPQLEAPGGNPGMMRVASVRRRTSIPRLPPGAFWGARGCPLPLRRRMWPAQPWMAQRRQIRASR